MNSSKDKKVLVYIVMGILSLAGTYAEFTMCKGSNSPQIIAELVMTCVMFALTLYYAISNFKVPHGNLLKYLFLAFSAMCFAGLLTNDAGDPAFQTFSYIYQISRGIVVIISAYIAGRLDRIKENTILLVTGNVILLGTSLMNVFLYNATNITLIIFFAGFFILWLDLTIAYLFRYYGHKQAGFEDKK